MNMAFHQGSTLFTILNAIIIKEFQQTLKVPITTKVVCFCRLLKCFRSFFDSVDLDQTAPT